MVALSGVVLRWENDLWGVTALESEIDPARPTMPVETARTDRGIFCKNQPIRVAAMMMRLIWTTKFSAEFLPKLWSDFWSLSAA